MKRKIMIISFLILLILSTCVTTINAEGILDKAESFIDDGEKVANSKFSFGGELTLFGNEKKSAEEFEQLAGLIWGIGVGVVLIVTVIIGIKLMITPAEQKAEVKKAIVPYLVGTVVIFGAVTIWQVLVQLLDGSL